MNKTFLIFLFILIVPCLSFTQNLHIIDSLKSRLTEDIHDTERVQILYSIGEETWLFRLGYWDTVAQLSSNAMSKYEDQQTMNALKTTLSDVHNNIGYIYQNRGEFKIAYEHYIKSLKLAKEIEDKTSIATSVYNIGLNFQDQGDFISSAKYFDQSMEMMRQIDDQEGIAMTLNAVGTNYQYLGDIEKAIDFFHQSLAIKENIGDTWGIAASMNNIGLIHLGQSDPDQALKYFLEGLALFKSVGEMTQISIALNNIGLIYKDKGDYDEAIKYYKESLRIDKAAENKEGAAYTFLNLGVTSAAKGDTVSAISYYTRALEVHDSIGSKLGLASSCVGIGRIELGLGKFEKAKAHLKRGLETAQEIGAPKWISLNAQCLSRLTKLEAAKISNKKEQQAMYQQALAMYELHIIMRDSLNNEQTQKTAIRQQTKYEYEKEELNRQQAIENKMRIAKEELSRRDNLQYSIIFFAILLVFAGVLSLGVIQVSPKVAEVLIFFSFLIFFEFILVLADPYVDQFSKGAPGYKLLFNAILAGVIYPLHAFFEKSIKLRLVRVKNFNNKPTT